MGIESAADLDLRHTRRRRLLQHGHDTASGSSGRWEPRRAAAAAAAASPLPIRTHVYEAVVIPRAGGRLVERADDIPSYEERQARWRAYEAEMSTRERGREREREGRSGTKKEEVAVQRPPQCRVRRGLGDLDACGSRY